MPKLIVSPGNCVLINDERVLPGKIVNVSDAEAKRLIEQGWAHEPGKPPATAEKPKPFGVSEDGEMSTAEKLTTKGPWSLNPADLEGMDLEDLQILIYERDSSIEKPETVDEAIAILSSDFKGA